MTKAGALPRVFTIPAGCSFVDSLAARLLQETAGRPHDLSRMLVLLPGRRACRSLREAFLRQSGGNPLLLPRLRPLGDLEADEMALRLLASGMTGNADMAGADAADAAMPEFPPAMPAIKRQVLLARMIGAVTDFRGGFDQAARLAAELGRFLDEVETEGLDFSGLQNLAPAEFSRHWQVTLDFLSILTAHWPDIMKEEGGIGQAELRNRLLRAQAALWQENPPDFPVIVAGVTAGIPAVAALCAVVAALPAGRVVLPGLDRDLDEESWNCLEESHPQFLLKKLLADLGVARDAVRPWAGAENPRLRARLASEIMRPAGTAEAWRELATGGDAAAIRPEALTGLVRVDCATQQEEAEVIALKMRHALETPGRTAALVTPDRTLARRVASALRRWGIAIDDSAGQKLSETPCGGWLRLVAEAAAADFAPVPLLACLGHSFAALELTPEACRSQAHLLEARCLRGPRPAPGISGLGEAVVQLREKDSAAAKADARVLDDLVARLTRAFEPLSALQRAAIASTSSSLTAPFSAWLKAHVTVAENLAATDSLPGAARLWRNEDGEAAAQFVSMLMETAKIIPDMDIADYTGFVAALMQDVTVRPKYGRHPRLAILGHIEARLYAADVMILGALNEGTWPPADLADPWMSRPMRRRFGLPAPERAAGIMAHDFSMALCAPEVLLTRSARALGAPTVPSRWLVRMETVLKSAGLELPQQGAREWLHRARMLDEPGSVSAAKRPEPRPPVFARPRSLSATRIETWMRDPYEIYARYILGLKALDPLDADPGAAERGTILHKALEAFVAAWPDRLPGNAVEELIGIGRKTFADARLPPEVRAFWWPRFEKTAQSFIAQEEVWRKQARTVATEEEGRFVIAGLPGGDFTVTAKADRIDRMADGSVAIIDYKTGKPPKRKEIDAGYAPQLPIEALIAANGGFASVTGDITVSHLSYWHVGAKDKPVEIVEIDDVSAGMRDTEARLRALVSAYDEEETPYIAIPRPSYVPRYSDYRHLERVAEWSVLADDAEE